jgi:hypothetical protein
MRAGFLGLALALLLALPAVAATEGVIEGNVVNKTPEGAGIGGIELTLHIFQGGTEMGQAKTTTDSEGLFSFSDLNAEPEYSYDVTLTYQEADYTTESVSFGTDPVLSLEVDVYDATSSPQEIKISQSHTVITTQGNQVVVLEVYLVENAGSLTYVGSQVVPTLGRKETLRFSLPHEAGAIALEVGLKEQYLAFQQDDLVDTMPVPPGTTQIAFSYQVLGQKSVLFQKRFDFPTDYFNLLVEDTGLTVDTQDLSPAASVDIQGASYLRYDAVDLHSGSTVSFTISGLPTAGTAAGTATRFQWALVWALALVLGVGLVYSLRRRPAPARVSKESREELLLAIARLDEDFEAKKVPEAHYRRRRAELMGRLLSSRW